LGGRFGGFVSGLEIPFPGNRDPRAQRRGSNAELPRRKSEHLVLPEPFGRHVAEAGYSHAMGEPALDGRFDEIGREECERDRHVDLADTASLSLRDTFQVGEKLVTHDFGTGTRGFAAPEDCSVAICILPGTEFAFEKPVKYQTTLMFRANTGHTVAIFRQINKGALHVNHDALEFPDGEIVLLTRLCEGQKAAVLTLPTQPKTAAEVEAQQRVAHVG
jgi:hypothetical protein